MKSSGIGGQAVIEGIMMRHKNDIAVAVRKADGNIVIGKQKTITPKEKFKFLGWPIIRGIVSFIYSMVIGIKTLTFSASFFEDEEPEPKKEKKNKKDKNRDSSPEENKIQAQEAGDAVQADEPAGAEDTKAEKIETDLKINEDKDGNALVSGASLFFTVVLSLALSLALFMVLPYYASSGILKLVGSDSATALAILEGFFKLAIFIAYVVLVGLMPDIKRTYMYHGSEHKCINCIESGKPLTVDNVMASSKEHRRCGTSFMLFVLIISIIFFIFLRFDQVWLRTLVRLLLIPVIAGVSFEFIQWAGNSNSKAAAVLSKPGLWVQGLTTKEPTADMVEVAIASVEAVFDWRGYLHENGVEVEDDENGVPVVVSVSEDANFENCCD